MNKALKNSTRPLAQIHSIENYLRRLCSKWLERVQKDFSVHYYEMSIESVKWINRYLGGFKLVEITPYIIQSFYDKLDEETYTVTHITPKLNALREVMDEKHISYSVLRHKFTLNPATLAKLFGGASVGIECATTVAKFLTLKSN